MLTNDSSEIMMLPVLRFLADDKFHEAKEIRHGVSHTLKNGDRRLTNWVAFAFKNLQRAETIDKVGEQEYQINKRGHELLSQGHESITIAVLKQYPEMRQSLHIAAVRASQRLASRRSS